MGLLNELRYVLRSLQKSPVFASVAILSLALGIGANTAVFSLLDQAILRLLPVRDPGKLVQLKEIGQFYGSSTGMGSPAGYNALSYPVYEDLRNQNTAFSGMICRYGLPLSISFGGRNERAGGEIVSGTYFDVLGVRPALGRLFTSADDRTRSGAPFVVLGYGYWQTRFSGDPSILGQQMLVNGHSLTIIGVAQKGFEGVEPLFHQSLYVPMMMAKEVTEESKPFDDRRRRWVQVFARLKPGVSAAQAKASLQPIFHRILEMEVEQPEFAHTSPYTRQQFLRMSVDVVPGGSGENTIEQDYLAAPLWASMALVGLVLLIACANVANLMIARATARQKEIAVRLSLGATRWRIVGPLLLESGLLSLAGGLLGVVLSIAGMRLLNQIMPQINPPVLFTTDPDGRILVFTLAISLISAILFGLAPALQATRPDLAPTLKDQANAVAGGGQVSWRKLLVCAQVSLSLLLLISAGLFVRTLKNLKNVNPGFEVNHLLSFSVNPILSGYDVKRANLFYRQLNSNLASLPGAQSAALAVVAPLSFDEWDKLITVEGYTPKPGEDMNPYVNYVSPSYFETLKIPIFSGRDFTDRDRLGAAKVAIVNEKFARYFFGNRNPLGRHIGTGGDPGTKTDIEIVGVVRDTKYEMMRDPAPREVYFPYLQSDWATEMTGFVRTDLDPAQMFPLMRQAVQKLDSNLPVFEMKTEERTVDDSLAVERLSASLAGTFGVLATVLAAIGLYGVMAFLVARRTREIGIRIALGAIKSDVLWIIMREVFWLSITGILIGLPVALAVVRLLQNQLFGMSPYDPLTISASLLGILAIAAISGYWPARRAMRVDPITALRYE